MTDAPFDLLFERVHLATCASSGGIGELRDASLAVRDGRIAWLGPAAARPPVDARETVAGEGRWLTPGLIDCHTHLVWGGSRADEFEARLAGKTYAEIAAQGGGIRATVRATQDATDEALRAAALRRRDALAADGVTTLEVKSGYGLDTDTECRQLRIARQLEADGRMRVRTTLLGLHALPAKLRDDRAAYVRLVCEETLPTAHAAGLVDAVDAFCEHLAFTPDEVAQLFDAARRLGLPVKLHADQLSDLGGGALAARYGALSADHLEYVSEASVRAMADAGTVAVLLPGAFYTLRETQRPPVDRFRAHGVPMAIATDANPGTSPCTSLLLMLHMACTFFGVRVDEALLGVTRHAARALGLEDETGRLAPGLRADLALWDVGHPRELVANFGQRPCVGRWLAGERVTPP